MKKHTHLRQILLLAVAVFVLAAGMQAQDSRTMPNAFTEKDDLETLAEQYYGMDDIESKYALVEVLKAMGDYEGAEFELRQIGYRDGLTEKERGEHGSQTRLFALEKRMHEDGRGWREMTEGEKAALRRLATDGAGRARHTAVAVRDFYGAEAEPDTKQTTMNPYDFPFTCLRFNWEPSMCPPIHSDELKFVFIYGNICSRVGDTLFVQGAYKPAANEYPEEDLPAHWYLWAYTGYFEFQIYFSDSSLSTYYYDRELCLTDKQYKEMNIQISVESDFATGFHYPSRCAEIETHVDGHQTFVNTNDTLGAFCVKQLPELATPLHDHGEGTVTISWTGFDGTPRQHVLYFIIDDHFYIDYVGLDENEEEPSMTRLRVHPNPTEGVFTIGADDITAVEVFDQLGQKVLTDRSGNRTINAGSLPTGVYFLKAETQNGTVYGKLMKK